MSNNFYELTYIINPVLEEEQIKAEVENYTTMITEAGGTIDEVDEWGVKDLAYEIDKKRTGYYVNVYFEVEGGLIAKLERAMTIDDHIMRFLTMKYDKKMLRYREAAKKGELPSIFRETED